MTALVTSVVADQPLRPDVRARPSCKTASVQTTERYLGCKQKFRHAVNDNLGVEDS